MLSGLRTGGLRHIHRHKHSEHKISVKVQEQASHLKDSSEVLRMGV